MTRINQLSPFMKGLIDELNEKIDLINGYKANLGLNVVSYDRYVRDIKRQIETSNAEYTIAFVGMFNSGKSTVINSLLGLKGNARLSEQDRPDTAKSIRICYRTSKDQAEAKLVFEDGSTAEMSWVEAKQFTSQVFMDENPHLKGKAEKLVEVVYYFEHPILEICNFLDLPGTGSKNWHTHTELTHQKLTEAEQVFWVIATNAPEPSGSDLNDLKILKNIQSNVVPFINVWADEEDEISGVVTPEEMKESIRSSLSSFISPDKPILKYYAREIDKAKQEDREIEEHWGDQEFKSFFSSSFLNDANVKTKEKLRRISNNVKVSLLNVNDLLSSDLKELKVQKAKLDSKKTWLSEQKDARSDIRMELKGKIRKLAADKVDDIIQSCIANSNTFIEDKMRMLNFKMLVDAVKAKDSNVVAEKLTEEFRSKYLKLDEQPSWLDQLIEDFVEDVKIIVEARWNRFIKDFNEQLSTEGHSGVKISSEFVDSILGKTIGGILTKLLTALIGAAGIFAVIALIPGGAIVDAAVVVIFLLQAIFQDPLEKHRVNAKLRAKVMISNQRYELKNQIAKEGLSLHDACERMFDKLLAEHGLNLGNEESQLVNLEQAIKDLQSILDDRQHELSSLAKGE
ncbi:dynamin family protein [Bacillus sp. DJP31]|uniref:dynamin family protein n=1 Tax=Bacillus sp. DJP31 TaxID=3409789 RepID=UPI003BB70FCD